ncbi:hypothetical protein B484DRAFT_396109 [Ochromonadaceae sp. CCMP2298]|nr:hypothetical protein B484DRAFT_396109 [Ochromonadaceae sp. CCMP2298]
MSFDARGEGSAGLYPSVTLDGEGCRVDPSSVERAKTEKAKTRSKVKSKEKRGLALQRARQVDAEGDDLPPWELCSGSAKTRRKNAAKNKRKYAVEADVEETTGGLVSEREPDLVDQGSVEVDQGSMEVHEEYADAETEEEDEEVFTGSYAEEDMDEDVDNLDEEEEYVDEETEVEDEEVFTGSNAEEYVAEDKGESEEPVEVKRHDLES